MRATITNGTPHQFSVSPVGHGGGAGHTKSTSEPSGRQHWTGRLRKALPIIPEILQVVVDQLQNLVQPCPERDLARGALSLKEAGKGRKKWGAAFEAGKGRGGASIWTGEWRGTGCRELPYRSLPRTTMLPPSCSSFLWARVTDWGGHGPGRGSGVGHGVEVS